MLYKSCQPNQNSALECLRGYPKDGSHPDSTLAGRPDILMIQDTRYRARTDGLPNLIVFGYHTYHIPREDGKSHGLTTLIKSTIHSELAEHIYIGENTESLTVRIWLNDHTTVG